MDLFSPCFHMESPFSLAQEYLVHKLSNNKLNTIIVNLRCQTSRNMKNNFHTQYMNNLGCIFNCVGKMDSQENILAKVQTRTKYRTTKPTQLSFIQPNNWQCIRSTEDKKKIRLLRKDQEPAHLGNKTGACGLQYLVCIIFVASTHTHI